MYDISVQANELALAKKDNEALVNFDDGVELDLLAPRQPRHLQFFCKTTTKGDAEACDVRLAKQVAKAPIAWPQTTDTS